MTPEKNIGIVTEQGDLGLGFDPISEEESTEIINDLEEGNKRREA